MPQKTLHGTSVPLGRMMPQADNDGRHFQRRKALPIELGLLLANRMVTMAWIGGRRLLRSKKPVSVWPKPSTFVALFTIAHHWGSQYFVGPPRLLQNGPTNCTPTGRQISAGNDIRRRTRPHNFMPLLCDRSKTSSVDVGGLSKTMVKARISRYGRASGRTSSCNTVTVPVVGSVV